MSNFIKNYQSREVMAPVAAGASIDSNSDIIDMSGYDSITFIVPITDSVATGVATLKVEQNTANSDTGMAAISGAEASVTCVETDDLNGQLLIVEVSRPTQRYLHGVVTSGTANIAFGNMIAILGEPRTKPVSQHSTVSDMALVAN